MPVFHVTRSSRCTFDLHQHQEAIQELEPIRDLQIVLLAATHSAAAHLFRGGGTDDAARPAQWERMEQAFAQARAAAGQRGEQERCRQRS